METTIKENTCHMCIYKPDWHVTCYDANGHMSFAGFCKRSIPVCDERKPLVWSKDNPVVGVGCPAWVRKSGVLTDPYLTEQEALNENSLETENK